MEKEDIQPDFIEGINGTILNMSKVIQAVALAVTKAEKTEKETLTKFNISLPSLKDDNADIKRIQAVLSL